MLKIIHHDNYLRSQFVKRCWVDMLYSNSMIICTFAQWKVQCLTTAYKSCFNREFSILKGKLFFLTSLRIHAQRGKHLYIFQLRKSFMTYSCSVFRSLWSAFQHLKHRDSPACIFMFMSCLSFASVLFCYFFVLY